eukprot:6770615-Alexandrium_andersonii.AAC.1
MCIRDRHSEGSIPQGDPVAMLGMATVLLFPTLRIQAMDGGLRLSVYADDRNAASPSEQTLAQVEAVWQ